MMVEKIRHIVGPDCEAEDHLALDEALLLEADEGGGPETLRTWHFDRPTVVLGRSSKITAEVDLDFCRSAGIQVLRRCSGGASILGGPGCLMYSIVLSFDREPQLQKIDFAHQFVVGRVLAAVGRQVSGAEFRGICDLTWDNRKFSGNALRICRRHLLYHGTILYQADLELIARSLAEAPRQPRYRRGRDHRGFLCNVPVEPRQLATDLQDIFGCLPDPGFRLPVPRMRQLRAERYDDPRWHHRH